MKNIKLGSILTAAGTPLEIANASSWCESASSVYVLTRQPMPSVFGLNAVTPRKEVPSLWEALVQHMGRMKGRETIGIGLPRLTIPKDFTSLQTSLAANKMELSWAFSSKASPDSLAPNFFCYHHSAPAPYRS